MEVASAAADRRLALRAGVALALANLRYWLTVAPLVRSQLRHWERRAHRIRDPALRALALEKLRVEGFTAEAAAMLATLTPPERRAQAVRAIVALEVMYDYLDGRTELPSPDPLADGRRLYGAFTDAVELEAERSGERNGAVCDGASFAGAPGDGVSFGGASGEDGYLQELSGAVRSALAQLPARHTIADAARASAARSAQAQIRTHAAPLIGAAQLEAWARREAHGTSLEWREMLAGSASSVLALHALIALAADPRTTAAQAAQAADAYLSISALSTMLDSLVDHGRDVGAGEQGFLGRYESPDLFAGRLLLLARHAVAQARELPRGAHHVMVLAGVIAYYTSAPEASSELARPIVARLHDQLGPLMLPTLAVMQSWRAAKRARGRLRGVGRGSRRAVGATGAAVLCGAIVLATLSAAPVLGRRASLLSRSPAARFARVLNVRDEGHLHFLSSSGAQLTDEGQASGTFPGRVRVRFTYNGDPLVLAQFTIYGAGGSISGRAQGRLNDVSSPSPSFRGSLSITGGRGRYAHVRGGGELFGVYYRRGYGLLVQTIATLRY